MIKFKLVVFVIFLFVFWTINTQAVFGEVPETETETVDAAETETVVETEADEEPAKKKKRPLRVRAKLPKGVFGEPEPDPPKAEETLLGGTVPALWKINPSSLWGDDDESVAILDRDSLAPAVPGKVLRYGTMLFQRYDINGDGVLDQDEWQKMPGSPQAMDVNGDLKITMEELLRFIALYGKDRTIHRPYPVARFYRPQMVSSQFQLFQPISPQPTPQPVAATEEKSEEEKKADEAASKDLTEESLEEADTPIDDATYEEIVAGRQVPVEKKYYTPPEALRGVPAWFILRDRDGDGQVSLLEFAPSLSAPAIALFGRLDKNGDGFITPDEVRPPKKNENESQ